MENTMRPIMGLNELRDQIKMTWIAPERGCVATPEDIVTLKQDHGGPPVAGDPYRDEGGEG